MSQSKAGDELQGILTSSALSYLKAKYDTMITGVSPREGLIAEYDGMTRKYRNAQERLDASLKGQQILLQSGMRYTKVEVELFPHNVEEKGDKVILHATEQAILYYTHDSLQPDAQANSTEQMAEHYFVFTKATASTSEQLPYSRLAGNARYSLKEDWIEQKPSTSAQPSLIDPEPPGDGADDSNFCCYAEEAPYANEPLTDPPLQTYGTEGPQQNCAYDGDLAAYYAYNWAFGYSSYFRRFDNDCTNFASQALYHGNWLWKGFRKNYKNWGYWWYYRDGSQNKGQSRTWTQARALYYFVRNSGRGFATSNICDMQKGDLVFADWNRDGMIDHVMVVTGRDGRFLCHEWAGVLLSQHSPGRRDKPLIQYLSDEPNALFYGTWICHTGPSS
jgi:hypothetical protein